MKKFSKFLALMMATVVATTSVNVTAFAGEVTGIPETISENSLKIESEECNDINSVEDISSENVIGNVKVTGNTGVGDILAGEINDFYAAKTDDVTMYSVADITVDTADASGKKFNVAYSIAEDAYLVVGIYDDNGIELKTSEKIKLNHEESTASLTFKETLPATFLVKGYIIEEYTYAPLSNEYVNKDYTRMMKDFYEKTSEDFDEKNVINLADDDIETNFVVFNDDVKLFVSDGEQNKVVMTGSASSTEESVEGIDDKLITVLNAELELLSAEIGSLVCIKNGDDNVVFQISAIESKDSTSITFTPKKVTFEQVFDYVDIDTSKIKTKHGKVESKVAGSWSAAYDAENNTFEGTGNVTNESVYNLNTLASEYNAKHGGAGISMDGEANLTTTANFKFAYCADHVILDSVFKTYYKNIKEMSFSVDYSLNVHVNFTATFNATIPLGEIPIQPLPCIGIVVEPSLILNAKITLDVTVESSGRAGISYSQETGVTTDSNFVPPTVSEVKAEGEIYVGLNLTVKIGISTCKFDVLTINLSAEPGVIVKGKLYLVGTDPDKKCSCSKCLDGDVEVKLTLSAGLEIFEMDLGPDPLEIGPKKVLDFYYCFDSNCKGAKFALTECPHKKVKITLIVEDESGKKINGASVTGDATASTDANGKCTFDINGGHFAVDISAKGYASSHLEKDVTKDSEFTVVLKDKDSAYDMSKITNFYYDAMNGKAYGAINATIYDHYAGAEAIANSYGGHLVTITSEAEQAIVYNLLQAATYSGGYNFVHYLGLRKSGGSYAWVTGEPFSYSNWSSGYPKNDSNHTDAIMRREGGWESYHKNASYTGPFNCTFNTYLDHNGVIVCEWDDYSDTSAMEMFMLYNAGRIEENVIASGEIKDNIRQYLAMFDFGVGVSPQPEYSIYENHETGITTIEATGAKKNDIYNIYGVSKDVNLNDLKDIEFRALAQVPSDADGNIIAKLTPKNGDSNINYLFVAKSDAGTLEELPVVSEPDYMDEDGTTGEETMAPEFKDKNGLWATEIPDQIFINKSLKPSINVYYGKKKLVETVDYTLAYKNNKAVSTSAAENKKPTITIKCKGNLKDSVAVHFNIKEGTESEKQAALEKYNAEKAAARVKITIDNSNLEVNSDVFKNGIVAVKGGAKFSPVIYYKNGSEKIRLYAGKDYTLSFANNVNVNQASTKKPTVSIKGKGKYKGTVKKEFKLNTQNIGNLTLAISGAVANDKKNNYVTAVKIIDTNGKYLSAGKDYEAEIKYESIDNPTAVLNPKAAKNDKYTAAKGEKIRITVKGKDNYTGSISKEYVVSAEKTDKIKFNAISKIFTGKKIKITLDELRTAQKPSTKLPAYTYEIDAGSFRNNMSKGTAVFVISGTGEYSGDKILKFKIQPKSVKLN